MVIRGNAIEMPWLSHGNAVDVRDNAWSSLAMPRSSPMEISWLPMGTHGNTVGIRGNLWSSVVTPRVPWECRGHPWKHYSYLWQGHCHRWQCHGRPWQPMVTHRSAMLTHGNAIGVRVNAWLFMAMARSPIEMPWLPHWIT